MDYFAIADLISTLFWYSIVSRRGLSGNSSIFGRGHFAHGNGFLMNSFDGNEDVYNVC